MALVRPLTKPRLTKAEASPSTKATPLSLSSVPSFNTLESRATTSAGPFRELIQASRRLTIRDPSPPRTPAELAPVTSIVPMFSMAAAPFTRTPSADSPRVRIVPRFRIAALSARLSTTSA
ncbi:hypothetical protein D3C80_1491670 [compost metagenome]